MKPRLLWCDLETTGLDPETCTILEIACVVTTSELVELAVFHRVIGWNLNELQMTRWPWTQHTDSGLLTEVENEFHEGRTPIDQVESDLWHFVLSHTPEGEQLRLAGSSIHFDKGFLAKYMPRVLTSLHYRLFDVSSFYEICPWMGIDFPKTNRPHRAMEDIRNSLSVARFFRERLMK